jgi:opacity protein-like surface antigen
MIRDFDLRYATALAALTLLFLASPAHAEEQGVGPDYSRTGFYVGGGVAYATDLYEDEIEDALNTGFDVDIEDTFGLDVRGGWRFLRFLAVELQYEWLDEYDIKVGNAGGKSKVDTQTVTANLKVYLPIKRFQPYVLGGIGFQRYEIEHNYFNGTIRLQQDDYDFAGRVGLGFDVYLTEHVVFYAEGSAVLSEAEIAIPIAGNIDNLFYAGFQGGVLWRF